ESTQAERRLATAFAGIDQQPLDQVARDPAALDTGRRLFVAHCAMCHGSDARGGKGFPNLADDNWQWGGSPEQVLASVTDGRQAQMPALANVVGSDDAIKATAHYVQSLSDAGISQALSRPGKEHFQSICAACHGVQGLGNSTLGAPNLADDYWLYGGNLEDITTAIRDGHAGQMPAHGELLGPTRARLAAAYVYSLSRKPAAPGGH
ncbi:MAG: c-type cytochrome, partial [Arenimonas sp.]